MRGFESWKAGDLELAAQLYQQSLGICRTAEGHTLMGSIYHAQGRFDDAIAECKRAIEVDDDFGIAFHDIGMYLILKGKWDDAIPWFERALASLRYETPQFAWLNLGIVYSVRGWYRKAEDCFERCLKVDPACVAARERLDRVRKLQQ